MRFTRSSVRPVRWSATIVLSNVGFAGSLAIFSTSASSSAIAASSAGAKSATFTRSNGGTPPYGPAHGASSAAPGAVASAGFAPAAVATSAAIIAVSVMTIIPGSFTIERLRQLAAVRGGQA
jgi:hypothetical protein